MIGHCTMSVSWTRPDVARPPLSDYKENYRKSNTHCHSGQLKMIHITSRSDFGDEEIEHVEEGEECEAEEE